MNFSILGFIFVILISSLSWAQEEVAPSTRGVEKIEVTGSRIKRIDVEGPSPILTIDQDDLIRSGYNSVSDILRDTGVNSFGSFKEHGATTGAGTAAVDLRGLGQTRTLVLLNGQRLPTDASAGSVDLNVIPMAAVERVEILKDGASAIYGSDALAGVVNIITKKNFDGHEFGASGSMTEAGGGERRDLSYTYGYNSAKVNWLNVLFFRQNARIEAKDREWSKVGLSTYGSPGSYNTGSGFKFDPAQCPADKQIGNYCRYNFGEENWEMPDVLQSSLLSDLTYKINEELSAFARLGYTYKNTVWTSSPAANTNAAFAQASTAENPDFPAAITAVRYRFKELGNRMSKTNTHAGSILTGLRGYMGETWDWETSISYNRIDRQERRFKGYALISDIQNAIDTNQFNMWAPEGQRGDLTGLTYIPQQNSISENTFFELKSQGEIGNFAAGPIGLAVGLQGQRELYRDGADDRTLNGEVLGIASTSGGGARNSFAAFSEFGFLLMQNLESNVAFRFDHYDDFGSTVNPKLSFRYTPVKSLMIRASAGTGFKAPQMQKLYAAQTTGFSTFIDQVWCNQSGSTDPDACNPKQQPVVQGGNRNLHEEKSFSANLGTVYQATDDHSFGLDLWYYDLSGLVEDTNYHAVTVAEANGISIGNYGASADRDPVTGELQNKGLYAPYLNISSTKTQGLDFSYSGLQRTKIGDFKLRVEHSYMFYYETEPFPGIGVTEQLGQVRKPRWRNNSTLFYLPTPNHEISLLARSIGEHSKTNPAAGKHPIYTEYDIRYSYAINSWNGKLTVGIHNFLGLKRPVDDSNPLDPDLQFSIYDERGRALYVGYRQSF
ncbi:MAG: TonB-dependent receptor [Bdellovibrionales bacterium]|nr:TonB-dependent receptor [Bdellovibrionales bacterium]